MDMYPKYISPFGYQTGEGTIDSYGVNHNGFSLRDELEYQYARQKRENQLMKHYNAQGITSNYPQYGTNFWGNNAANNYGFGVMNIADNIEKIFNPLNNNLNQGVQYAQNNLPNVANDIKQQPYIFSSEMRDKLGHIESDNRYDVHTTIGGGIGALGKYQIRRGGLIDTGYLNQNNQWIGKNGIYSVDDFLSSPEKQEQVLDEYLKSNYNQLKNKGALNYLGVPMQGIIDDFDITDTGLLAASHREGAGAVNNYLNHLVKNSNGRYYINYDDILDKNLSEMFKRIETRLRKFEK